MDNGRKERRTALLIRCTEGEVNAIREAAGLQRRTVSAFVLQAVMNRISIQQRLEAAVPRATERLKPRGISSSAQQ